MNILITLSIVTELLTVALCLSPWPSGAAAAAPAEAAGRGS